MTTILMIFCAMALFVIWLLVCLTVSALTTRVSLEHYSNVLMVFLCSVDLFFWVGIPVLALKLIL